MKSQKPKASGAQNIYSKVKPVVVKHVLTQNYIQKPEIYQNRPNKQYSQDQFKQSPSLKSGTFAGSNNQNFQSSQQKKADYPPVKNQTQATASETLRQGLQNQQNLAKNTYNMNSSQTFNNQPMIQNEINFQNQENIVGSKVNVFEFQEQGVPTFANTHSGFNFGSERNQQNQFLHVQSSYEQILGNQQIGNGLMPIQQNFFEHQNPDVQQRIILPFQMNIGISGSKSSLQEAHNFDQQSQSPFFLQNIHQPNSNLHIDAEKLKAGMQDLIKFAQRESIDPNSKVVKVIDPKTGMQKLESHLVTKNFDAQSIRSDMTYKWSAIGEMTNDELDQLKVKNSIRIDKIEQKYFKSNAEILTAKQIMRERQENFQTKEYFKDASINYPTYGRGLQMPGIELNTFMVQPGMCEDQVMNKKGSQSPSKQKDGAKRKRILSPKRQKFETRFERYLSKKLVDDKLVDQPPPSLDFDTTTKPEGTLNVKVNQKLNYLENEKKKKLLASVKKSLPSLEKDAEEVLKEEVIVILGNEMLNKLKEVFEKCKEKGKEDQQDVETQELIHSIAEEPYLEERLNNDVRESVDGERETLENLLLRILKIYKQETINWSVFLGFFTKRGRLRDNEEAQFSKKKMDTDMDDKSELQIDAEEDYESKLFRLQRDKEAYINKKVDLVPKTGKGKFNVTVPQPFESMEREKVQSTAAMKFQQMMEEKRRKEQKDLNFKFQPKEVPQSVKQKKFEKIMITMQERREEAKRLAMAKIKATEQPFNFYKRDVENQKMKQNQAVCPQNYDFAPFRAKKIPWWVLVPLFKSLVDDAEADRVKRIKKNSEIALKQSKLPPRMEAHEKKLKEKSEREKKAPASALANTFRIPPPKEVPDFKRIHKEFAAQLERNKSAVKLTTPKAFNFHEPKNDPSLRKHLDNDNQIINPTLKNKSRASSFSAVHRMEPVQHVPTTKKHEAMVALRRKTQNQKIEEKISKQTENYVRKIKAVRLFGRIKQSPVFVNNAADLKQKRTNSLQRYRDQAQYFENSYNQQKAVMEFNVANRPLLFEQQTQEFINLYNQIRDLQKYVAILRNQNLDPNDYLTDNQKILLQRAQYFDQLNQLAYFPGGIPIPQGQINGPTGLDEKQLQQMSILQNQRNDQISMQNNGQMPVDQQNNFSESYEPVGRNYNQMQGVAEEQGDDETEGDQVNNMGEEEESQEQENEPEIIGQQRDQSQMDRFYQQMGGQQYDQNNFQEEENQQNEEEEEDEQHEGELEDDVDQQDQMQQQEEELDQDENEMDEGEQDEELEDNGEELEGNGEQEEEDLGEQEMEGYDDGENQYQEGEEEEQEMDQGENEEDEVYELDEEQYQQIYQNMLINQQNNPQNPNAQAQFNR